MILYFPQLFLYMSLAPDNSSCDGYCGYSNSESRFIYLDEEDLKTVDIQFREYSHVDAAVVVSEIEGIPVNKKSVQRLKLFVEETNYEDYWLNDEIINFYFQLPKLRDEELHQKFASRRSSAFINSSFAHKKWLLMISLV